jgi:signal transduction histidine kinase
MKAKLIKLKFWQKAFFLALALFLVAFDILGYIISKQSFAINEKYMQESALVEQQVIVRSLYDNTRILSDKYGALTLENMHSMVEPYAEYYKQQGVYLTLLRDGEKVFDNTPDAVPFFTVAQNFPAPFANVQLLYKKDISLIESWHKEMIKTLIIVSVIVSGCMSAILLFMLLRLTSPFRKLNLAATEIKNGHYDERANITSTDEIGEFAESFNVMAESVQTHIESRERFTNNLAHEMRTPITAIAGYAEMLKIANLKKEEKSKAIDYILEQSLRMKTMVYKLMDLAYLKNNVVEMKTLRLEKIISRVIMTCQQDNVAFVVAVAPNTNIKGDEVLIESLIQNLTENAIKAGGKTIKIATQNQMIIITDNGKGMAKSEISKITEPFYRVNKSRSRDDGGVGLGLALCVQICKMHYAKLDIASEIKIGTQIKIEFTTA